MQVRTLQGALGARQLLEGSGGALRWDGLHYERHYRRLLSPPLQRLLTQPGVEPAHQAPHVTGDIAGHQTGTSSTEWLCGLTTSTSRAFLLEPALVAAWWMGACSGIAALGRGCAAMTAADAAGMGARQALMQLGSKAVRAAAQSPFLDAAVGRARGVLAILYLPPQLAAGARGPTLHRRCLLHSGGRASATMCRAAASSARAGALWETRGL